MEFFAKLVIAWKLVTIFTISFILNAWQVSAYASGLWEYVPYGVATINGLISFLDSWKPVVLLDGDYKQIIQQKLQLGTRL